MTSSMKGTSQSAQEYSLLLKKPPTIIKKFWPPPKLGPKKTVLIIAFRIALTLDVQIVWFDRQMAVCVQKRHKNAIFECSWFQKFNFDCLLLKLLICSPKTENSQSWTFETDYTQKLHFYAVSGHKQPSDDQTIQFGHQVSKQFWKLWSTRFFWDQA